MPTNFPVSLDTSTQLPNTAVTGGVIPAAVDNNASDAIMAAETKLGTGASVPTTSGHALVVSGAGATAYRALVKADVGLGSVDNTADASKPVSTAQAAADATKQNTLSLTTTGTSGASTLVGATLNIPSYAGGSVPTTTKGDIAGFSTVSARVPVGTDAQVLVADSTQPLGIKWATPAAGGATKPRHSYYTMFEGQNINRFLNTLAAGGTTPFSQYGIALNTTATVNSLALIGSGDYITGQLFDTNPSLTFMLLPPAASGDWKWYTTIDISGGMYGEAVPLVTGNYYAGISIECVAGVITGYAVCANGVSETKTAITYTASRPTFGVVITSGVNVKYYTDGVLVATHTTNVPTGAMRSVPWMSGLKCTSGTVLNANLASITLSHDA